MTDLLGSLPISNSDKLGCARRELKFRKQVYPRLVQRGSMKREAADLEIEIMTAIVADYEGRQ